MKKLFVLVLFLALATSMFAQWWDPTGKAKNSYNKELVVKRLIAETPVPEIRFGWERKMIAWRAMTFDVENKMGFVYLICSGIGPMGYYTVIGKVASLNSFLTRQNTTAGSDGAVLDDYDIDGTTGENVDGVFFRTTDGAYVEIPTNGPMGYIYSDKPIAIFKNAPLINPRP